MHTKGGSRGAGRQLWPAGGTLLLALGCASPAAWCAADDSPLRKFEKGAQPSATQPAPSLPAPSQPSGQDTRSGDAGDHHDDDWLGDLLNFLFSPSDRSSGSSAGGGEDGDAPEIDTFLDRPTILTMARLHPRADAGVRRDEGDALIPYVRYDFAYQHVSSSASGYDNRLELGYGVISVLVDDLHLTDRAYGVSLTVDRYLLQYRVSVDRHREFDFALGETDLLGANYTQLGTVSVAARFMVTNHVMLEFRPTWANTIQDYEGAAAYSQPGWSVKAGYRSVTSPGGTLQGPFIGFSLYD